MVGLCGVIGDTDLALNPLREELCLSDQVTRQTYEADDFAVHVAAHPQFSAEQPARTGNGALVWLHGNVYGYEGDGRYRARDDLSNSDPAYCAKLYNDHGLDFVSGLNGEFVGVIANRDSDKVHLFTDRIGSQPLYHASVDDTVLFASRLQAIGLHPAYAPTFDREALAEFFSVQKVFGSGTPLAGVKTVPPATVMSVGTDGTVQDESTYWQPRYRPVDRSPAELASTIAETVQKVVAERTREDLDYGVLLSGGSDSRLVLGAMREQGSEPKAFHLCNWMSQEARVATAVAEAADVEFQLLERDAEYHRDLLERVPQHSNFVGAFDESIAAGFPDELASVDVVLTGYLGDTMFGTYPLFLTRTIRSGFRRQEDQPQNVSTYIERYLDRYSSPATVPDFLDAPAVSTVMNDHITHGGKQVHHHGITYPSLRELQLCEYYPLTNQFAQANSDSIRQHTGHWSPFFDNRLIDLHLSIPVNDRIRQQPIDHAVHRLAPELAEIIHAQTGQPLARLGQSTATRTLKTARATVRQRFFRDQPPAPYLTHGAWMQEGELIRHHPFIGECIERNADLISALPFLDGDRIDACYQAHLDGADNWRALYTLATLLETPVADRIAADT